MNLRPNILRLLILALFVYFFTACKSINEQAFARKNTAAVAAASPKDKAEEKTEENEEKHPLEISQADEVDYKNFHIKNSVKGLSIERKGKRLLFLKSDHGDIGGPAGEFGFQSFFGTAEKQLVYDTWTGGNHCCRYYWIVNLSLNTPKIIFRGKDYDVQHSGERYDPLGTADFDGDGIMEVTQSHRPYHFDQCAEVSQPLIYTGFKYNKSLKQYLPVKEFIPPQKERIEKLKNEVTAMNAKIRAGENPEDGSCGYRTSVVAVTLNYIFIGREKEGYDYLKSMYLAFDRAGGTVAFNRIETKKDIDWYEKNIKKQLNNNKLYKHIYER